jgi:hypothetical protein
LNYQDPDDRTSCVQCFSPFAEDDPESEHVADFCTSCAPNEQALEELREADEEQALAFIDEGPLPP